VPEDSFVIQRFLAHTELPPAQYRALRHLDAFNASFGAAAWMDAWTEVDPEGGFRYEVAGEGGSGYIRRHVFRPALEAERRMWAARDPQRAALTLDNYAIEDRGSNSEGLASLGVKPRRKDVLLIDGSVFVNPADGDMIRVEGRLSKTPSFWTRRVDVVRKYDRIGGIRVPVAIESVAQVVIAGRSTFKMTYEYETINGQRVGNPQPRILSPPADR
jgi:hypothetical protein